MNKQAMIIDALQCIPPATRKRRKKTLDNPTRPSAGNAGTTVVKYTGIEVLQLRVLARARGQRGFSRMIGAETRTEMELVEAGDLFQEIEGGEFYRFTLSPTGRRRLDAAEATGWRATDQLPKAGAAT